MILEFGRRISTIWKQFNVCWWMNEQRQYDIYCEILFGHEKGHFFPIWDNMDEPGECYTI